MENVTITHEIWEAIKYEGQEFIYNAKASYEYFVKYLLAEYDKYILPKLSHGVEGHHVPARPSKVGELAICWSSFFCHEGFMLQVKDLKEAEVALDVLAKYDQYVFAAYEQDYCNAGGLNVCEDDADNPGELTWYTWYAEDGSEFDEYLEELDILDKAVVVCS